MGFHYVYGVTDGDCSRIQTYLNNTGNRGKGIWLDDTASSWIYNNLMDTSVGVPQTIFVDREMRVREHRVGFSTASSPADFINIIETLLAE